jgi:hypothetical protein
MMSGETDEANFVAPETTHGSKNKNKARQRATVIEMAAAYSDEHRLF